MDINYNELEYDKEIRVKHLNVANNRAIDLSIELKGIGNTDPDCKIGHFGYNFWLRTNAGIKGKKYNSRKRLEMAVEALLKKNDFEIIQWVKKEA